MGKGEGVMSYKSCPTILAIKLQTSQWQSSYNVVWYVAIRMLYLHLHCWFLYRVLHIFRSNTGILVIYLSIEVSKTLCKFDFAMPLTPWTVPPWKQSPWTAHGRIIGPPDHIEQLHWHHTITWLTTSARQKNTAFNGSWTEATVSLVLQVTQLLSLIGMATMLQWQLIQ